MSRYLLDTNVLLELMRARPASPVLDWFARNAQASMHTSAVTQAEILTGIALLPAGKRRTALATAAGQMFALDFADRILGFEERAAERYATIVAARTRKGLPISTEDAQIAAIALAAGLPLVTRNTKDFAHIAGLTLVDPWHDAAQH